MKTHARLAVMFGVVLALLVGAGWLAYVNTVAIDEASRGVLHRHRVQEELAGILRLLAEADAAVRGYAITGREDHLAPFGAARVSIERALDDLEVLLAGEPVQQRSLEGLRPLLAAKLGWLDGVVERRRAEGFAAAAEAIRVGPGGGLSDEIRQSVGRMLEVATTSLTREEAASRATAEWGYVVLAIGLVLGFLVLWPMFYRLYRETVDREQAQKALRGREEHFRLLVESVRDYAIFLLDSRGCVMSWNKGAQRIAGYTSEEIVGKHISSFYPEEGVDAGRLRREVERAAEQGRSEIDGYCTRKDGSRFWANTVITGLRDDGEGAQGFAVTIRDVSERKRFEDALAESEMRHREVSELTSDYAYSFRVGPNGAVVVEWITGAFTRITGYTPEEVDALGGGIRLVHPDDMHIAVARLQTLLSRRRDTSEFRILTKTGEVRWIRESARPQWDEAHQELRVYGAAQDITDRRRAEEEAHQHQTELAHVLRVGTIGEMATGLAHEINQPLSAIVSYARGCVRRIRSGPPPSTELLGAIEDIAEQAIRADQIVRRLQSFVRKEEPRRERVEVNDLVKDVARLVAGEAAQRKIQVRLELAAGLPAVHADGIQVEQVILNLARNGLEAMDGLEPKRCVLSIATRPAEHNGVEVVIRDEGAGIATENVEKVFTPFFTTKPHGLGMGLAISRSIVEAHGGRIRVSSAPGRGTMFRFTLPLPSGT